MTGSRAQLTRSRPDGLRLRLRPTRVRPARSQLSRPRLAGLLAVLVLLGVALALSGRTPAAPAAPAAPGSPPALPPALVAARAAAALPPCPPGLSPGLPDVRLDCLDGGPAVRVAAAPGRPLLVNLWATWCGPCVREVPDLVALSRRAGDRVGVVGVATDDDPALVYAFAKQFGVRYPLVRDDAGRVSHAVGSGLPRTLLVTADGRVAHVQVGAFPSARALDDAVATYLGVRL